MESGHKKNVIALISSIVLCAGVLMGGSVAAKEPLPSVTLPIPEMEEHIAYLGVGDVQGETFTLADIDTDILLIELFSMYCPYCQAEAPNVNEFYQLAEKKKEQGVRVKVIGLGASNSRFEVDYFKESFDVEFPLFADEDLSMYKKFEGDGTPGFIGCLYEEGKAPVIVLRQSGGFDSAEEFLALLLERAGVE